MTLSSQDDHLHQDHNGRFCQDLVKTTIASQIIKRVSTKVSLSVSLYLVRFPNPLSSGSDIHGSWEPDYLVIPCMFPPTQAGCSGRWLSWTWTAWHHFCWTTAPVYNHLLNRYQTASHLIVPISHCFLPIGGWQTKALKCSRTFTHFNFGFYKILQNWNILCSLQTEFFSSRKDGRNIF